MPMSDALVMLDQLIDAEYGTRHRRHDTLLSEFPAGFTKGWCFAVPREFRSALDVRQQVRRSIEGDTLVWLQGANFDFQRGDVLYDTPAAYEDRGNAKVRAQVRDAAPVRRATREIPRGPGSIIFELFVQDEKRARFVSRGRTSTTQDAFVRFLIEGPPPEWEMVVEVFRSLDLPCGTVRVEQQHSESQGALFEDEG